MDLLALSLDVRQRQCHVRAAESTGVVEEVLTGDAFARVYTAAQPLFEWAPANLPPASRRPADATLVSIELDALERTVRLGYVAEQGTMGYPTTDAPPSRPPSSRSYPGVESIGTASPPSGRQASSRSYPGVESVGTASPSSGRPPSSRSYPGVESGGLASPSSDRPASSRSAPGLESELGPSPSRPPSGLTPVPELSFCHGDYSALQHLLREPARAAVREVRPRKPDPQGLTATTRWEYLYQHGGDGWELGRTPPPLARWLASHPPAAGQRTIVLGCGRGHEAQELARAGAAVGAQVVAVDLATSAVQFLRAATASSGLDAALEIVQADLFTLCSDDPRHRGAYDLVLEHCCFCAIDPARRDEYVAVAASLLKPDGQLVGLFYCHDYPGGPPYATSATEVHQRLGAAFTVTSAGVPDNSIITRAGQELLVTATRR